MFLVDGGGNGLASWTVAVLGVLGLGKEAVFRTLEARKPRASCGLFPKGQDGADGDRESQWLPSIDCVP